MRLIFNELDSGRNLAFGLPLIVVVMAYVIIDTCTKDNECIAACPVDCIHPTEGEDGYAEAPQLFVHPDDCIDCGACVPVCPTDSIHLVDELAPEHQGAIARNAAYYGL